jgi:hypothetical protein
VTRALLAVLALAALGCIQTCEDHDCARVELALAPLRMAGGATASVDVSWMRAHYGGPFCPETPSVTSTDDTIVRAAFVGDCGRSLTPTALRRGSARIDVANGGGREGWRDIDVVPIGHLAVLPSTARSTDRQDPVQWEIHVGTRLDLIVAVYDEMGGPIRADGPSWRSLDPSIVTVDGTGLALAAAPGETDVEGTLLGGSATLHIVVQP